MICPYCGNEFNKDTKYCSVSCSNRAKGEKFKGTSINSVKIDISIKREDITKEVIEQNINKRGCLDQNFYKKLPFEFTSKDAYLIYHDMESPRCKCCSNDALFISFTKGFRQYCSSECSNKSKERVEKIKETALKEDINSLNSYHKGARKMVQTKESKYPDYNKPNTDKEYYTNLVKKFTRRQNWKHLENSEKRGNYKKKDAYHLDHCFSIHYGFKNNIPPWIIGNIVNLQMLPALENTGEKNKKCYITKEELFKRFFSSQNVTLEN